jgi:hypothetical protein
LHANPEHVTEAAELAERVLTVQQVKACVDAKRLPMQGARKLRCVAQLAVSRQVAALVSFLVRRCGAASKRAQMGHRQPQPETKRDPG